MSEAQKLKFIKSTSNEDINNIYNFNVQAFADSATAEWSEQTIKDEVKNGWSLYSVQYEGDIVAAVFMKEEDKQLLTKNTPIKMEFQGNGFSHRIKDFYEEFAAENSLETIVNYCPADSFRLISLNERHNYEKTGNVVNDTIEWKKELNK